MKRKPTRRDLLVVIARLQHHIGCAHTFHGNDRDPDGFEKGQDELKAAEHLCHEASAADPPVKISGPWAS
jgi:hypothetical protein